MKPISCKQFPLYLTRPRFNRVASETDDRCMMCSVYLSCLLGFVKASLMFSPLLPLTVALSVLA